MFEDKEFDKRIIKLNQFPEKSGIDFMFYDPLKIEQMIQIGYDYTSSVIKEIFVSSCKEDVYAAIKRKNTVSKNRITTEILLTNLNKAMARFSKRKIL